jgi:hypothetical protein
MLTRATELAERNTETLATLQRQLDHAALADAWEHGKALTSDQAIAVTRESSDELQLAPEPRRAL